MPVSMKITDSPGAMLVMPVGHLRSALPTPFELSSIFQPVMFDGAVPVLVTSNQSALKGLLPLDQGATSEMMSWPAADVPDGIRAKSVNASSASATSPGPNGRRIGQRVPLPG